MIAERTQVKYLKIINTHDQIKLSLGEEAPYISRERITDLTLNALNFKCSRVTLWRALRFRSYIKKREKFLLDE